MIADRDDLDGAMQRLRRGIQSLNREGRERLLESFEKVNSEFPASCSRSCSKAAKPSSPSRNPKIRWKPASKSSRARRASSCRSLSLLSGGEQALTAMALIFAVFLVNPAPVCVLDEVDAPLDDANVERFCNLLDEMTRAHRHALPRHHPPRADHVAHEPAVRRDHGRARREPARVGDAGRSRTRGGGGVGSQSGLEARAPT